MSATVSVTISASRHSPNGAAPPVGRGSRVPQITRSPRVVRAAVTVGETVSVGSLDVLFEAEWIADALGRHDWDIHPNGQSFVAVKGPATEETEVDGVPIIPVQIVVNFFEELRQRMGN